MFELVSDPTMRKLTKSNLQICLAFLLVTAISIEDAQAKDEIEASTISPGKKEIVIVTEEGIKPKHIKIERTSSVFFLNGTSSSKFNISVDLGKSGLHCWTKNLQKDESGKLSSIDPVAPRDFALMCFPNEGEFKVDVVGVDNFKSSFSGTIEVN